MSARLAPGQLDQIRAWYRDPVRKLPRKVVVDVSYLVAEVCALRDGLQRIAAMSPYGTEAMECITLARGVLDEGSDQ